MNFQKQIIGISVIFIIAYSILFYTLQQNNKVQYELTKQELRGVREISKIHKVDIVFKNLRGLSQLNKADENQLAKNLFVDKAEIPYMVKELRDERLLDYYEKFLQNSDGISKVEIFERYSYFLKLLQEKMVNTADSSKLLLESEHELYFLMYIIVFDTSELIETAGKIRGMGTSILTGKLKNSLALRINLHTFSEQIDDLKFSISKLTPDTGDKLNILLESVLADFLSIKTLVPYIDNSSSTITSRDYFLKISQLVNKLNSLYGVAKNMLESKLDIRESELEEKLLIGKIIYMSLILLTLAVIFVNYRKISYEMKSVAKKEKHQKFINFLQDVYAKDHSLKELCEISLKYIIQHFNALNGSLYLYNQENNKLYLGATYGIKYELLAQSLDMHENIIAENILEQKISVLDIDDEVNMGNLSVKAVKLVTMPVMEFNKSIGTLQLVFDEKFKNVDLDFLQEVLGLMGTYIYKGQKDDEALRYLKLIDKYVLISQSDLDGNIVDISEQLCELSGYSKEELIGQHHRIFRDPDTDVNVYEVLWNTITADKIWSGELRNRKKDGSYYWIDAIITPEHDINGNIIGYTAIRTDITNKKLIEEIAITDALTTLYNRRHFDTIFPQQMRLSKRDSNLLAFVLIDIDHFKQYNDTYGHQDGDTTLKSVAIALKNVLKRPNDYTFRLGGEEFGMLYHVSKVEDAIAIAQKAKQDIESLKIEHEKNSASDYVTISGGLYIILQGDESKPEEIYKMADELLYNSKQNGRNQITANLCTS